ncbi:uncharacterized protein PG998_014500 [Apiospora kogelbergensis]|uniref:uncharacterized protein n=1 Tax=Apiospora kogelbergensis TaxID=1337665 RepID=UPI00312E2D62
MDKNRKDGSHQDPVHFGLRLRARARAALDKRMSRAGQASGIPFNWGGQLGPNPRQPHRPPACVFCGRRRARQIRSRQANRSGRSHLRGLSLPHPGYIPPRSPARSGTAGRMKTADVDDWLQRDQVGNMIDRDAEANKVAACTGVPTLVIQNTHRPGGIPNAMDLMELFI